MSDNSIIIIPEDPFCIPQLEAQERALAIFRGIAPRSTRIFKETSHEVRFVDCGGNFTRIVCPHCNSEMDITWWSDAMNQESLAGFPIRQLSTPCCRSLSTLHHLRYNWPQGFAKFSIEATNPEIADLTLDQINELERTLGSPLRKILHRL